MADDDRLARLTRLRREPPPLQAVMVEARVELSPRLLGVTFLGDGLRVLVVDEPAASVRLLVPTPGTHELVMPEWDGNEFLLPDGSRPALRTFTPLRVDNDVGRIDIQVVRHPGGAVSKWAETVEPGAPAAISGPGSGYEFPADAESLLVLADETALPAASQLLDTAPVALRIELHVEVVRPDSEIDVAAREGDTVEWHVTESGSVPGGRLVDVVESMAELPAGTHLWAAGEASAMHAIRTHLFDTLCVDRKRAAVRGYWKPPR